VRWITNSLIAGFAAFGCINSQVLGQQTRASTNHVHYLRLVKTFDLPGPVGKRFDYLTIDTDQRGSVIADGKV